MARQEEWRKGEALQRKIQDIFWLTGGKAPNQLLSLDRWVTDGPSSNLGCFRGGGTEETLSGSHLHGSTWGTLSWLLSTSRIMTALTDPKSCLDLLSKRQWRLHSNWNKHMRWMEVYVLLNICNTVLRVFKYIWLKFSYIEKTKFGGENQKLDFEPSLHRKYLH